MAFIDGTVVNVALPALQRALNASLADVQWVVEAYALFLAALLLVGGAAGDRFGRRRVFLLGVALFALSSVWCGLAGSVRELILARALQGIGGALLVPGSLSIISASFAEQDRGKAIGTWSGATAITAALGPVHRRLADRSPVVACHFLPERSVGHRRHRDRAAACSRKPEHRGARRPRLARSALW